MKVKNQKETKRSEFRKNKVTEHPAYIFAKIGNKYKYIGLTHADITDGVRNIKLDKNPNPTDKSTTYAKPKTDKARTNDFKQKEKTWKFSRSDKEKINKIIKK